MSAASLNFAIIQLQNIHTQLAVIKVRQITINKRAFQAVKNTIGAQAIALIYKRIPVIFLR
jgi:hypothetical protein